MQQLTWQDVWAAIPPRGRESNKGSYGAVVAAAGSLAYRGAAALACEGALRTGAGLVYLMAPEPVVQLTLTRTPECCALPCEPSPGGCAAPAQAAAHADKLTAKRCVLLAGPGLGTDAGALTQALLT
ncbi:MAG: NAD(P)H-hydrate dehydratase, partial [Gemmiger sp.]